VMSRDIVNAPNRSWVRGVSGWDGLAGDRSPSMQEKMAAAHQGAQRAGR
jgi:hypothetical protein